MTTTAWADEDAAFGATPAAIDAAVIVVPPTWRLLDDTELMQLPDPQWIIDDVFQNKSVVVIYSPPGTGKTTFAAAVTVSVATGKPLFGRHVRLPGCSVYGAAEDAQGWKLRIRSEKRARHLPLDLPLGIYTFPDTIDLRDVVSVVRFIAFLNSQEWPAPLRLVVIDTYAASMPGAAENSAEDTTTAMVNAQKIRNELGVTVVLIHHTNAAGNRERGHSAMRGAADTMLVMNPSSDDVIVEASKQRNGPSGEELFRLKLVPLPEGNGCVFRLASDVLQTGKMTASQVKIYAVLRDVFSAEGATKTEWNKACADVPDRTFFHAAKRLTELGYVKAIGTHFRITGKVAE